MIDVSILMSVYIKEKPAFLDAALFSIVNQSLSPKEIVIVEDGPLTTDLYQVIDYYTSLSKKENAISIRVIRLETNKGLGIALQKGLQECHSQIIARMDSDDIAKRDRIAKQFHFMESHPNVAVCGGNIEEFSDDSDVVRVKTIPIDYPAVLKYARYRNPVNHMTVMFRKEIVEQVGGYHDIKQLEDYDLWIRILARGYIIENIPSILVSARTGNGFADRRGGKEYYQRYKQLRMTQRRYKLINWYQYYIAVFITFIMTRSSSGIRKKIYKELRK
jgi:Glycosyltransferases, probably involved in cell wall biogenesis